MLQPCLWKAQAATQYIFDTQLPHKMLAANRTIHYMKYVRKADMLQLCTFPPGLAVLKPVISVLYLLEKPLLAGTKFRTLILGYL